MLSLIFLNQNFIKLMFSGFSRITEWSKSFKFAFGACSVLGWVTHGLKQKNEQKMGKIESIFLDDFRKNRSRSLLNCWWQLLPFAKFEWFIHAFNWKPQTWKMGSDFPKAHTATRAKLASHKIIQQNSDQNLPLRNICLIKSGLHHSNCIFFSRFSISSLKKSWF